MPAKKSTVKKVVKKLTATSAAKVTAKPVKKVSTSTKSKSAKSSKPQKSVSTVSRKGPSRQQIILGFILAGLFSLCALAYMCMNSLWIFVPGTWSNINIFKSDNYATSGAASSPAAAVEGYMNAVNSKDGEKAKLYLSDELIRNTSFELFKSRDVNISYRKISDETKGNTATMIYSTEQPEATMKLRFTVENLTVGTVTSWVITGVDVLEIQQK